MSSDLKLYVWRDFCPGYTGDLAFAIAPNEDEARNLVIQDSGYSPDDWGELEVLEIAPVARSVSGGG